MLLATRRELLGTTGEVGALDAGVTEAAFAAAARRQEQERRIDLSQQLLAPAVAAAARAESHVDVVPLVSGLSNVPPEEVEVGLSRMMAGGVVQVIGEEDEGRAGRLRIAPTEIGLTSGYRVLSFDVGGEMPLPRADIAALVEAQDAVNIRDGVGQDGVDRLVSATHDVYFPQPPIVAAESFASQPAAAA